MISYARNKTIGVFGHVGNGNLGDEAIISAVIQNIKRRCPNSQIVGFTINPADTTKRHNVNAFPIRRTEKLSHDTSSSGAEKRGDGSLGGLSKLQVRIKDNLKTVAFIYAFLKLLENSWLTVLACMSEFRFLIQCYRNIKNIDLMIVAGSQQLIDYVGGAWAFPYTLFKWALLAKLAKTEVAFVSVGVGPIRSILGKFFIRKSLLLAGYRSFRDESSRELIEKLGVCGPNWVIPDLVYSLQLETPARKGFCHNALPVVGINPVPFNDEQYWLRGNAAAYEVYIAKLAVFALWLIEKGYVVSFFPTQLHLDPPVIKDIRNVMKKKTAVDFGSKIIEERISSFNDLISAIDMTDIVVATRFHGIVIPYVLNKPVLGIAYQEKTIQLMAQMDQSEYVVDINSFDLEALKTRFISLQSRSAIVKDKIKQRKLAFRQTLQNQYDQVLSLI